CVAIPDDLSPGLWLGQPSPEELLRTKALADRALAWWDEVLLGQTALSAEQIEAIREARGQLEMLESYFSPEQLAILRMAVRDGGVRCPHCGFDIASDAFGIMIYLAVKTCMICRGPLELDVPAE